MSAEPSRKRAGDGSSENSPRKVPSVPDVKQNPASHDVVLTVKGHTFYCLKEKLAEHSTYFMTMFFSEFAEKDKKEVDIGEVEPDVFQLFIDAVNEINSVSDEYSEVALVAAIYLGSSTLEEKVLEHLAGNSEITLQEQFKMAEDHKSSKLMIQVFASIKDAYELDKIVPKDLDSFCNTTKNIIMQRSFELLGIRKPPKLLSPPLPEEPDQVFEHMMNQIIDQVVIQNHHGEILKDQTDLLFEHVFIEKNFREKDETAEGIFHSDPLINELLDQLRGTDEQEEKNFIHAQVQVLKLKHFYERLQNPEFIVDASLRPINIISIRGRLAKLAAMLNRDERSQARSEKVTLGNREIDEIYRRLTAEAMERNQERELLIWNDNAVWLESIKELNERLETFNGNSWEWVQRPRPDGIRYAPRRASFDLIDDFISNARRFYYMVPPEIEAQNPREQDQEGN